MQDFVVQDLAFGRFINFSKVKRYKLWLMFMIPVMIVRHIKICPCPSVHPSVRLSLHHTLWNIAFIFKSYSFQSIFLKPCILVVDIIKMYMWKIDGIEIILTELQPFELSHSGLPIASWGMENVQSTPLTGGSFFKCCTLIVNIMMYTWFIDRKINFNGIMALST